MRRIGIGILLAVLLLMLSACTDKEEYVNVDHKTFPDEVLYTAARGKDTDHDTKLSKSEIENATKIVLDGAKDYTGLEVFTNLEIINIRDAKKMKYDFRHFTNLRAISIDGTWASNCIDLSGNANLQEITIKCSNLEELILPEAAPLRYFSCSRSQLTGIDLNSYKGLRKINLESNDVMTELDFRDLPDLTDLTCSSNKLLNTVNISGCPNLKKLNCTFNNLSHLNISGSKGLEEFKCYSNCLPSLDLSAFTKLKLLECDKNELTKLDVSNCPELTKLVCSGNSLTALDLSSNPKLKELSCDTNGITDLDLSCCPDIVSVACYKCGLTRLNISGCSNISSLICYDNDLSVLDITGCAKIRRLICSENNLQSLDVSKCPVLLELIDNSPVETRADGSIEYRDGDYQVLCFDNDIKLITK